MNIVIVGAGQIGSRHLQSLAHFDRDATVYVVDPSEEALRIAKGRFEEEGRADKNIVDVFFEKTLKYVPNEMDVGIIATNSNIRKQAIMDLLTVSSVRYLILEKFLFPQESDYSEIEELLNSKGIQAFVNCARRVWPIYKKVKRLIDQSSFIHFEVSSSNLGLGCNGIHFVDLLAYFTGEDNIEFNQKLLDKVIKESKRKGFLEFTGSLIGEGRNFHLIVTSYSDGEAPVMVNINTLDAKIVINETKKIAYFSTKENEWSFEEYRFEKLYVSQSTSDIIKQLIDTRNCDLTPYKESAKLHKSMLAAFIKHLNASGFNEGEVIDKCMIT
ncbi:Gfo/Idh/MocA family oxidoreductase [Alkalihalobacillus oceani]|uniref:Gfo/Idh/MocA family oxidoreductase n=1 Tax=Halalkalibacter oceani TaxID=1653776 RepID=UPI0020403E40|nr:Gfo/Idh/MocA family oxidoreductase [Halalkalibacter oceani]MCM3760897.1 Gfo/Idh/MocA family oxidoreductase [Halalkalibacter oceani]